MSTPTETPTPRVDAAITKRHHNNDGVVIEELVNAKDARQLESELVAVTKERDWLKNWKQTAKNYYRDTIISRDLAASNLRRAEKAEEELAEANADRARLREALGPFAEMDREESSYPDDYLVLQRGIASDLTMITERDFRRAAKALSTPPPPVVPIMDLFAKMVRELTHSGYIWNESIDRLKELVAKHPTSNLTSRGDVAG
jgi:hypothetical protein